MDRTTSRDVPPGFVSPVRQRPLASSLLLGAEERSPITLQQLWLAKLLHEEVLNECAASESGSEGSVLEPADERRSSSIKQLMGHLSVLWTSGAVSSAHKRSTLHAPSTQHLAAAEIIDRLLVEARPTPAKSTPPKPSTCSSSSETAPLPSDFVPLSPPLSPISDKTSRPGAVDGVEGCDEPLVRDSTALPRVPPPAATSSTPPSGTPTEKLSDAHSPGGVGVALTPIQIQQLWLAEQLRDDALSSTGSSDRRTSHHLDIDSSRPLPLAGAIAGGGLALLSRLLSMGSRVPSMMSRSRVTSLTRGARPSTAVQELGAFSESATPTRTRSFTHSSSASSRASPRTSLPSFKRVSSFSGGGRNVAASLRFGSPPTRISASSFTPRFISPPRFGGRGGIRKAAPDAQPGAKDEQSEPLVEAPTEHGLRLLNEQHRKEALAQLEEVKTALPEQALAPQAVEDSTDGTATREALSEASHGRRLSQRTLSMARPGARRVPTVTSPTADARARAGDVHHAHAEKDGGGGSGGSGSLPLGHPLPIAGGVTGWTLKRSDKDSGKHAVPASKPQGTTADRCTGSVVQRPPSQPGAVRRKAKERAVEEVQTTHPGSLLAAQNRVAMLEKELSRRSAAHAIEQDAVEKAEKAATLAAERAAAQVAGRAVEVSAAEAAERAAVDEAARAEALRRLEALEQRTQELFDEARKREEETSDARAHALLEDSRREEAIMRMRIEVEGEVAQAMAAAKEATINASAAEAKAGAIAAQMKAHSPECEAVLLAAPSGTPVPVSSVASRRASAQSPLSASLPVAVPDPPPPTAASGMAVNQVGDLHALDAAAGSISQRSLPGTEEEALSVGGEGDEEAGLGSTAYDEFACLDNGAFIRQESMVGGLQSALEDAPEDFVATEAHGMGTRWSELEEFVEEANQFLTRNQEDSAPGVVPAHEYAALQDAYESLLCRFLVERQQSTSGCVPNAQTHSQRHALETAPPLEVGVSLVDGCELEQATDHHAPMPTNQRHARTDGDVIGYGNSTGFATTWSGWMDRLLPEQPTMPALMPVEWCARGRAPHTFATGLASLPTEGVGGKPELPDQRGNTLEWDLACARIRGMEPEVI
jgi:hypothetical protein